MFVVLVNLQMLHTDVSSIVVTILNIFQLITVYINYLFLFTAHFFLSLDLLCFIALCFYIFGMLAGAQENETE